MKFIYVFTEKEKKQLLEAGFTLFKDDPHSSVYIFGMNDKLKFSLNDISYVGSDTLTF